MPGDAGAGVPCKRLQIIEDVLLELIAGDGGRQLRFLGTVGTLGLAGAPAPISRSPLRPLDTTRPTFLPLETARPTLIPLKAVRPTLFPSGTMRSVLGVAGTATGTLTREGAAACTAASRTTIALQTPAPRRPRGGAPARAVAVTVARRRCFAPLAVAPAIACSIGQTTTAALSLLSKCIVVAVRHTGP